MRSQPRPSRNSPLTRLPGLWILPLLLLFAACAGAAANRERELTVFAAASLAEAGQQLADQFQAEHPGVRVVLNFAGSQQLVQQLGSGAQADVFLSADTAAMQAAEKNGRVAEGAARPFAGNRLVVLAAPGNPAGIQELADLGKPGVRLVLADGDVPAGRYTLEFLQRASGAGGLGSDFEQRVLANVVSYEESVRFVLAKVLLGEADAGIVYASDARGKAAGLPSTAIPEALNPQVVYLAAPTLGAAEPELAQEFIELLLSPGGQAALLDNGFSPAEGEAPAQ